MFLTIRGAAGLSWRMNSTAFPETETQLTELGPVKSERRGGVERIRKPLALVCIAAWLYAAWRLPVMHGGGYAAMALMGHVLVALAIMGRIWSTLHIGGLKNGALCRSGPYERTRNPLYFFSWLGVTGLAMICREPWLVPLAWVGFAVSFAPLIRAEERRLGRLFGEAFATYRNEVPRFFPRLHGAAGAELPTGQTPGKLVQIEHALSDAIWFLVAAAVLEVLVTSGLWERLQGGGL